MSGRGDVEAISTKLWAELDPKEIELLRDPALLHRIKKELDRFIIGEDKNKLLLFLIAASSYTKWPLSAIVTGESSAGKSWLMNNVLRFFNNVEEYTRVTAAAPDRLGTDFTHKILKVEELRGADQAQASLRVWISEGRLRLLTTMQNEKDNGRFTTGVIETKGVPSFITTCTDVNVDTELLNRVFFLSVDESENQTKEVLKFEAEEYKVLGKHTWKEPDPILTRILPSLTFNSMVYIPYTHLLAEIFPIPKGRQFAVKPRRDYKKLLFLIGTIAWIHQLQRQIIQVSKIYRYVVATPADFYLAWQICEEGMRQTLLNLSLRHQTILELFKNRGESFSAREIAEGTGYSQNRAREILNNLVQQGHLMKDVSVRPYRYSLGRQKVEMNTIDDFVEDLCPVYEEKLEEWLKACYTNTTKNTVVKLNDPNPCWNIVVDPITGEEKNLLERPSSSVVLVQHQSKQDPSPIRKEQEEQNTKKSFASNLPFKVENVLKIERLENNFQDKCVICSFTGRMDYQVTLHDGTWGFLCGSCGCRILTVMNNGVQI
jgi:hypothetical protein